MLTIIDYGIGNLGAIANMLERIGVPHGIAQTSEEIASAARLILPGVAAFDAGTTQLQKRGWVEILNQKVRRKGVPIPGIRLGMQLLTRKSSEGVLPGLDWVNAEVRRFGEGTRLSCRSATAADCPVSRTFEVS